MAVKQIRVSAGFCLGLACMLMLVPLPWLLAAMFSAFVHELCHYFALYALSGERGRFYLHGQSAQMKIPPMRRGREAICALIGPLGSLCLVLLAPVMPRVAICAGLQLCYNLLPIYPLDGGRAMAALLSLSFSPPVCARVCLFVAWLCKWSVLALALYLSFYCNAGLLPILLWALLVIRTK